MHEIVNIDLDEYEGWLLNPQLNSLENEKVVKIEIASSNLTPWIQ